jgi:hypothetical protein
MPPEETLPPGPYSCDWDDAHTALYLWDANEEWIGEAGSDLPAARLFAASWGLLQFALFAAEKLQAMTLAGEELARLTDGLAAIRDATEAPNGE